MMPLLEQAKMAAAQSLLCTSARFSRCYVSEFHGRVVVFHDQGARPAQLGQAIGPTLEQQPVARVEKGCRVGGQSVLISAQDGQEVKTQGRAQAALSQSLSSQDRIVRQADNEPFGS